MNDNNHMQFENYLERIEAIERKERRKKAYYGLLGLFMIGLIAGGLVWWSSRDGAMLTYGYKELDSETVKTLVAEGKVPFAVYHGEMGRDTINTEDDFALFVSMVELMERQRESEMAIYLAGSDSLDFAIEEEDPESEQLQVYFVDIEGERRAGSELTLTIEDYDPSVAYTLVIGNGDRVRMQKQTTYIYPYGGDYLLRLYASREGYRTSVYTKKMLIEGPENPANRPENETFTEIPSPTLPIRTENDRVAADSQRQDSGREILLASANREVIPLDDDDFDFGGPETPAINPPVSRTEPRTTPTPPADSEIDFSKPLFTADVMPSFPGGVRAMVRYFRKNFRYPTEAREAGVDGVVFVRFVVQADGRLTNVSVFKGLGYGCDEEAIRLVKEMPAWEPGQYLGRTVSVYKEIPITFQLVE